ncbi:WXG100 family type VII secretion target [Rhodococcus gordoniae]|uniref:WXG100 family type VII secretion target n=1 Tax=Rhodococcus gordoniae TaxID=223392 RepID=A0A379M211_9NOCA|nr:hypothetical protein [Rhodococcus gordoniae]SUE15653.1 WXG100 family type VII secretion target [Rhodococcus gordoniae]
MRPGVAAVRSWNPDALRITADRLDVLVDTLDDRMKGLLTEQDVLAERWSGDAARAAAARVVRERSLGSAIAEALLQVAEAYRTGAWLVEGARLHLVSVVTGAEQSGFTVHHDGTVDPSDQIRILSAMLQAEAVAEARVRLEHEAAELTHAVTGALEQASRAATETADRITAAVAVLEAVRDAAVRGKVVQTEDGEFSFWPPDWPASIAGATIGLTADSTKEELKSAATASGDDVAGRIASRIGPVGAALGVIPAISNDIETGMDPAEAVVTESIGAAFGYRIGSGVGKLVGGVAGSLIAPGVGTGVGLVAGTVLGAAIGLGVSRGLQGLWR